MTKNQIMILQTNYNNKVYHMPIPQLNQSPKDSWRDQVVTAPTGKRRGPKKGKYSWKLKLFLTFLFLGVVGFVSLIVFMLVISRDLPNPNQLIEREINQSTKIYDRTGEHILYEIHGDEKRTLISLNDLPDYVKQAPIAIEDKGFYNHGGFSLWAMFRTAITNTLYNRRAGGSTLTQQFIKNAVLTPEKKIIRKLKEIVLSYRLEQKFSKDEILQIYLNEIPYGSNAYGIEAATLKYFGKNAKDLTIAESALLAALIQAPSRYSPYGPNKDLLLGRKDYVITLMQEQGYISQEEADAAKAQEIIFAGPETNITAPHFVMYIKELLAEKYGEKMVEQAGLKIYTTLDLYKQKIAEEVIKEKTENYQEKYSANNASLISIDPKTGQVLAMVGSRDYFNDEIDGQVNVSIRPRQPGSSMKPMVYASLFAKGYGTETILYDVTTNFSNDPSNPYTPQNYSGNQLGPVSVRKALAGSLNIPAVKALYLVGVNNFIDQAEKLGYTTLYPRERFGLALVLGGAEVKLIEHVNAYSAFARDGIMSPVNSILKIEDKDGNVIEEFKPEEEKVFDSQVARMINSILSDNSARAYVFGERSNLVLSGRPAAVKTGTTNDYRDAWTVGYTPSIVTGVWVGNSNNDKMKGVADGSVLAAPIWNAFMSRVLGDTPVENFKAPDEYKSDKPMLNGQIPSQIVKIDSSTGQLANSFTPYELISELSVEDHHSILFYVDKDNPTGSIPEKPEVDPQFSSWENAVKGWAEKNASSSLLLLRDFNDLRKPENIPTIKIVSPNNGETISNNQLVVMVEAAANRSVFRLDYFINGGLWSSVSGNREQLINDLPPLKNGYHELTVRACDDVENCAEDSIDFNLLLDTNTNFNDLPSARIESPSSWNRFTNTDFPLAIRMGVNNYQNIARLSLFAVNNEGSTSLISSVNNVSGEVFEFYWNSAPPVGLYDVYTEIKSWSGEINKSEIIKLEVF